MTLRTACIVSTGDELLRGTIADTNAAFLAARLRQHGVSLRRVIVVGDDIQDIASALREATSLADLVVVGGGLGPTTDDVTAQAAGLAFGRPLVRNATAEQMVRSVMARFVKPLPECNLKQADLPEDSEILPNECGTAPGFAMRTPRGLAVFLPGVPSELESMWAVVAREYLRSGGDCHRVDLSCFGMGESAIAEKLAGLTAQHPEVRVSYRAVFPEIYVGFEAADATLVTQVAERAHRAIGEAVFDVRGLSLPKVVAEALKTRGLTCGVAESCTGGQVARLLTQEAGASSFFRGGVVAYSNEIKSRLLRVSTTDLESMGAVSEPVARAMARGAMLALGVDIAVATTGIAGPDGATADKPLGLVHFAVALRDRTIHHCQIFNGYERTRVQRASAYRALRLLLDAVRESTC